MKKLNSFSRKQLKLKRDKIKIIRLNILFKKLKINKISFEIIRKKFEFFLNELK